MAKNKSFEAELNQYKKQLEKIKKIEDSLAGNYEFLHLNLTNFFSGDARYAIGVGGAVNNILISFENVDIILNHEHVTIKNVITDLGEADYKIISEEYIDESRIKSVLERIMQIKFISTSQFKKLGMASIDAEIKKLTDQKNEMINKLKAKKTKFI